MYCYPCKSIIFSYPWKSIIYFHLFDQSCTNLKISVKGTLFALDLNTDCSTKFSLEVGSPVFSSISISNGNIVFGCHDRHLYCVDTRNGKIRWKVLHSSTGDFLFYEFLKINFKRVFKDAGVVFYKNSFLCLTIANFFFLRKLVSFTMYWQLKRKLSSLNKTYDCQISYSFCDTLSVQIVVQRFRRQLIDWRTFQTHRLFKRLNNFRSKIFRRK